jgi:hypothetical protein
MCKGEPQLATNHLREWQGRKLLQWDLNGTVSGLYTVARYGAKLSAYTVN